MVLKGMHRVGVLLGVSAAVVMIGAGAYALVPGRGVVAESPSSATGASAGADRSGASASPGLITPPSPVTDGGVAGSGVTGGPAPGGPAGAAPPSQPAGPAKQPAKQPAQQTSSPPKPGAPKPSAPAPAACPQGERHAEVEKALAELASYGEVSVDGKQSAADCAAIKKFQNRFGISPANGRAGATTASVARRIAVSHTPAEQAKCGAGGGATVCVDLSQQTVWVIKDGQLILGPTVTRTGMPGYATPTGSYRIQNRNIKEWSNPYEVWMPYWQRFNGGIGFHETVSYLHNSPAGSHGCVNLLRADAKALWNLVGVGTSVRVFGRRPGT